MSDRPFPKPSPDRLLEILRINCNVGDILCGDAADEIERLRLTDEERLAIQWVVGEALSVDGVSIQATLRGLLNRTRDASK